jgi:hypothetical protein
VGVATNVLLGCVLNYFMRVSQLGNVIITRQLVSKDSAILRNTPPNHRQKHPCLNVRNNYLGDGVPLTFSQTYNNGFTGCTTSSCSSMFPTYSRLVNFNLSGRRVDTFVHEFANLFEYSPSCFVGDTQFPLELLSGDTSPGRCHREDSVKPRAERSVRFVEDSARSRSNTHTAKFTRVEFHTRPLVMPGYLSALLAIYTIWITGFEKEIKASIICRKLFLKVFYSVGFHVVSTILIYIYTITQELRSVKGYLP